MAVEKHRKAEKTGAQPRGRPPKPAADEHRELVRKTLALAKRSIAKGEMKVSATDLIRLLELSDKWERDNRAPVEARWVDPED